MNGKRLLPLLASIAVLASACTQKNTGDEPAASTVPQGLDRFLLFPNPLSMNTGGFETNTADYAAAYYRAVDPNTDKDTIDKFKAQNQFDGATGTQRLAVFRDTRDLGYGRRMTGRMNTDGSVAFYVENYSVAPNATGDYSSVLNVEAAIRRDTRWHVGTNAIEWSTAPCSAAELAEGCNPNAKFAKFYNFSSADGTRQLTVDLDGKGLKAMPGPCITCHGGRGDPLTPPDATGKPRFPLVENGVSRKRGDVQARLHGMNVDSFGFSPDIAGFSKTDQQATLKTFNQWILCTYPLPGISINPEDACRAPAGANEWQGTAAEMIKSWYGGPGMPNATFLDTYVPTGWQANSSVYTGVVAPFCRTCHILRGTKNQDDLDFMTVTKFQGYADHIKAQVFDRGTMPLALIVYNDFWNSNAPAQLANFINPSLAALTPAQTATDSSGAALKPGRPVASPGPNRMVRTGANAILTGEDSLFASSFSWSMVSGSATIANPNSMVALFNAQVAGDYVVQLAVGNGSQTDAKNVTITVSDTFPDPLSIKFAHVKNALQNISYTTAQVTNQKCVTCHVSPATSPTPPIFYNSFDRDGSGGAPDATDDAWFLKGLQGRANLTEIEASPLLRKPSGNHHAGKMLLDVADKSSGGGLSNYSILYNWILAGMPGGGAAASAVVNGGNVGSPASPVLLTFGGPVNGPYGSPPITLDGTTSVGATTFAWTVFGPPGPLGTPPSIANANSALATLTVFDVGSYVVQLQVTDGNGSIDIVQKTIVIGENPITASFTPATGTTQITFGNSPARGSISLTSTSTGNPTTCRWQIFGPAGATLGAFPTIVTDLTQLCTSAATLVVPASVIGSSYTVQLTASNIASSTADNFYVIAAAPGQSPSNLNFTFPASLIGFTVNNNLANAAAPTRLINGVPTSNITLAGSATGLAPLNFSWSLPSGTGTAGCSFASPGPSASTTVALTVAKAGSCSVAMTVSNGVAPNATLTQTVSVTSSVSFSTIASLLNSNCSGCHGASGPQFPSWVNDPGLFTRLTTTSNVVITGAPSTSLLLVCPASGCTEPNPLAGNPPPNQTMGAQPGFGGASFTNYDSVLTWITNGATNP